MDRYPPHRQGGRTGDLAADDPGRGRRRRPDGCGPVDDHRYGAGLHCRFGERLAELHPDVLVLDIRGIGTRSTMNRFR
ncbi:hypothetical protein, partial [Streptomyces sp. NPDC002587]